jgi:hypothetical protein
MGAIAPIPKNFYPYFSAGKIQKWFDITSNGFQNVLFNLDRIHSPSNRTHPSNKTVEEILGRRKNRDWAYGIFYQI